MCGWLRCHSDYLGEEGKISDQGHFLLVKLQERRVITLGGQSTSPTYGSYGYQKQGFVGEKSKKP